MRLIRMLLLAALACSPVFAHADDEAAVKRLTGMDLLQELEAVKLPSILRDAILERISARSAW